MCTACRAEPSRRALEDELRDPKTALEYFLPRPLRIGFFAITSVSCLIAVVLGGVNLMQVRPVKHTILMEAGSE
eukprot:scaffold260073_cov24-Tisochrysis_lutea.AAC.1